MEKIRVTVLTINGAPLEGENPLPAFRARNHDVNISYIEPFPVERKNGFGREAGFRVLPYRIQDRYGRKRIRMQTKLIVMENQYLRASFLPELGGRLYSLVDKETGKELLSRNTVFQPANLAIRNAWFSGGIEWNIGQMGHTFHTCSSVYFAVVKGKDGEPFLRMYEFERCKRLFWHMDFYLPDDSKVLFAYTRIINPSLEDTPVYWWTNIAVTETPEARVFASADEVIYNDPGIESGKKGFGYSKMPEIPSLPGVDFSYPYRSPFSNEYFFQPEPIKMPWEAVVYKEGAFFFEVSTERLRYRKMFCWGSHEGGRHWQEYLSEPGTAYYEIQSGLAPTQLHGINMPAGSVWEWTQAFGGSFINPQAAHNSDWFEAKMSIENSIHGMISENDLYSNEERFRANAHCVPQEILHSGSGWGALEILRMQSNNEEFSEPGLVFPTASMDLEQYPWLSLLQEGRLCERNTSQLPGSWMVQAEWKKLLLSSLKQEENRNWYSLLHAGVMAFEDENREEAEKYWQQSLLMKENIWALRNLAVAERHKGSIKGALLYMQKLMDLPEAYIDYSLAEEYLTLLKENGEFSKGWEVFMGLPSDIKNNERIQLIAGSFAAELGEDRYLEELFKKEYARIREGELLLTDIWFKYTAGKIARERGIEVNTELIEYVRNNIQPPSRIDFRMVRK